MSRKPRVHWDGYYWVAQLDHGSWVESGDFDSWQAALEHALWLRWTL